MPRREALRIDAGGEQFRFYYDEEIGEVLHIAARHGTTPGDAIRAFYEGATTRNEQRERFETVTSTHVLYWTRHAHDGSVVVISCFSHGEM